MFLLDYTHAARLQPVLEKHNMSAVGMFDGSSTAFDPQESFSLDAQDGPVESSRNPLHEAKPAGISFTASNRSTSRQKTPLASASEERGGAESADDSRLSYETGNGMSAHGVQVQLSREKITVGVSSRSDASGDDSLQQEKRRMGEDAPPMHELVAGSSSSRTPRDNVTPFDGMPPPDHVNSQGSLPREQGGLVRGALTQKRPGDGSTTDIEQGTGREPSVLDTDFDVHHEDPAAEGLLELHHGYRQIARPRTRSGSRNGTMGYGSTGGDKDGTKKDQATEGKECGKTPRNGETEVEMAVPKRLDEWDRSKLEEAGRAGDSSSNNSAGSNLSGQKRGESAVSTNDSTGVYTSQSEALGGSVRSVLNEGSTTSASPKIEAKQNEDFVRKLVEETVTLTGGNTTSAFTTFAAANGEEDAAIAMGSLKGGGLTATDIAAERQGGDNPRTAVPNYLSSSERGRKETGELRFGLGSGAVDDGSVLNGAQVEMQGARDPPSSRRTSGRNGVLSSIAVAGKKLSIDSEKGGGHQQGTAVGSNTAGGRKSVTAKGREGGGILRRSSSGGVWRYDDLEQHQRQQPRDAEPFTSLSVNPSSEDDVGKANLPAVDGRVSPGLRIGDPRRNSRQQHRLDSTRQMVSSSSGATLVQVSHSASAPEEYSENGGRAAVTSDTDVPVGETDPGIATGGRDLLAREDRGSAKLCKVSAENPHAEEAPFGIVGRGATLAIPFAGANAANTGQGGTITLQPSPVVQGKSTAAVANGLPSTIDGADVGLTHRNAAVEGGVAKADNEDMQVKPHREVEYDAGKKDLDTVRGGSSHRDRHELTIVSNGRDDTEATAVAHAADREKMAVAVARRISDITGTQYGEALAEVRNALMRSDGDEQGEARLVAEKVRRLTDSLALDLMKRQPSCSLSVCQHVKIRLEENV